MEETLTIGLTGDVMLGRSMDEIISRKGYDYPWGNMLPVLRGTDVNVINLETTLTRSNRKVYKTFNFKADPEKVRALTNANITAANLANNHILDFANEGFLETVKTLDSANIQHVGAGMDLISATSPLMIHKKTFTIGLLGITNNEPGWKANGGPGINYINIDDKQEYATVLSAIRQIRKTTDLVIVTTHWGPNMREKPSPQFVSFAHLMLQHGADVVHGHSAHILQGIERYHNSLILYDTGDFINDYAVDKDLRNDLSAFFILTINKSGILELQIIPTRIYQYQVNRAKGDDHDWVIRRLQHLSAAFETKINEKGKIELNQALHH